MKLFQWGLIASLFIFFFVTGAFGFVESLNGKVFIVDRTGTRWDVTQAKTLGFLPGKFQYGIGKEAFTTLDDSHIKKSPDFPDRNPRIIGIKNESETHAYSVDKLRSHEIANTNIGKEPIAAAY